ncbi:O-antigen polymerase [Halothermothrix orenii]|uniref:O-antigen ligase-related domain-containing protein n=1 Tax=Halothermothrix orenii (strain H 168 / OCM 544 / DSM 9562) TaxID=373903 RepID=B8D174_HALOH|nr:O-antigen polymerase [Halothermothrix orenii]ACL71026.1 hypothetical protein Hore_22810 [Halothermothrix orenii H 168]
MRFKMANISLKLLLLFFLLAPFHGVIKVINHNTLNKPILNVWKEVLFIFILALSILYLIKKKKIHITNFGGKIIIIIYLLVFNLILNLYFGIVNKNIVIIQWLWGVKVTFFYGLIIFIVIIHDINWQKFINKIINILSFLALFIIGFALLQFFLGTEFISSINFVADGMKTNLIRSGNIRASSIFRQPVTFGMFCLILLSFNILKKGFMPNIVSIMSIIGILISTSRTSILALVVMLFYCLLLKRKKYNIFLKLSLIIPLVIVFALNIIVPYIENNLLSSNIGVLRTYLYTNTFFVRINKWKTLMTSWVKSKGIVHIFIGKGWGYLGGGQHIFKFIQGNPSVPYDPVDNLYLFLLINSGIVGLILFISIIIMCMRKALMMMQFSSEVNYDFLNSVLLFLSTFLIIGVFITGIESFIFQIYLYLIIGSLMKYS